MGITLCPRTGYNEIQYRQSQTRYLFTPLRRTTLRRGEKADSENGGSKRRSHNRDGLKLDLSKHTEVSCCNWIIKLSDSKRQLYLLNAHLKKIKTFGCQMQTVKDFPQITIVQVKLNASSIKYTHRASYTGHRYQLSILNPK